MLDIRAIMLRSSSFLATAFWAFIRDYACVTTTDD
jgi:hypothetical protein